MSDGTPHKTATKKRSAVLQTIRADEYGDMEPLITTVEATPNELQPATHPISIKDKCRDTHLHSKKENYNKLKLIIQTLDFIFLLTLLLMNFQILSIKLI